MGDEIRSVVSDRASGVTCLAMAVVCLYAAALAVARLAHGEWPVALFLGVVALGFAVQAVAWRRAVRCELVLDERGARRVGGMGWSVPRAALADASVRRSWGQDHLVVPCDRTYPPSLLLGFPLQSFSCPIQENHLAGVRAAISDQS